VKKLNVILLIFSFILSGIGGMFLFYTNARNNDALIVYTPIKNIEEEEDIVYTYHTIDEYIENNQIPQTIGETTITGNGSESDPYIINSTSDFVFMFCTDLILSNVRSIELNCDISFNDEKFDEEGNPSGGDGKVYNYKYDTDFRNSNYKFNGNGHTIKGIYSNEESNQNRNIYILSCYNLENTNFENIFLNMPVYSVYRTTIINSNITINNIENCNIFSGVMSHPMRVCGFAWEITGYVKNCKNFAIIGNGKTSSGAAAFVWKANEIINCKNYGDIVSSGGTVCGIGGAVKIDACENYGKIEGYYVSGIGTASTITNSKNYGEIYANASSGQGGGISYSTASSTLIYNCENYGEIQTGYVKGQILGRAGGTASNRSNVIISSCKYKTINGRACVGGAQSSHVTINIDKCVFDYSESSSNNISVVIGFNYSYFEFRMKITNTEIIGGNCKQIYLFYGDANKGHIVKNVLFRISEKTTLKRFLDSASSHIKTFEYDGVVILKKDGQGGYYYGSDFSGFVLDYKSQQVSLKSRDSFGQFYASIDENWLINYKKCTKIA